MPPDELRRDVDSLPVFVRVRVVDPIRLRVIDANAHVRLIENLADLVADGVVDALHVELGGERLLHAVDDRELGRALLALLEQALRLVEQARVFERDAHAVGERLEEAHVGFAVRVLALHVDKVDQPAGLVPDDQRHVEGRFLVQRAGQRVTPVLFRLVLGIFVDDNRFARANDVSCKSLLTERVGLDRDPFPVLVDIRVVDQVGLRIVDADAQVRLIEDLADLVADGVVDALHVELGGQRLLHARDDGELGRALLLGLEQPLRLVEQARVLERDRHRVGERGQQAHVGIGERILLVAVECDDADGFVTLQDGDAGVADRGHGCGAEVADHPASRARPHAP